MCDPFVSKRYNHCKEAFMGGDDGKLRETPIPCSGKCRMALDIHHAQTWQNLARVAVGKLQVMFDAVVVRWYEVVANGTEVIYTETVVGKHVRESKDLMDLIVPGLMGSKGFWAAFNTLSLGETDAVFQYSAYVGENDDDCGLGPVDVQELVCFQGYHSGAGAVAIVVGFASKEAADAAHDNLAYLRQHIRVASDKLMRMTSQHNLTTALNNMREKSEMVGLSVVGSEIGRLWDVDEVSRLILRELGAVIDEGKNHVEIPSMFTEWIETTLKEDRRLCADTISCSRSFRSPRGMLVEARLYVEQVGSGGILVLRQRKGSGEFGGVFTRRELDVVQHLLRGLPSQETAHQLSISKRTVDKHLEHIYQKLGVNNRLSAVGVLHELKRSMKGKQSG